MHPVIMDTDVSLLSHRFDCLSVHTEYMYEFWFSWRDWTVTFLFLLMQFVFLFNTNLNILICIIMFFFVLLQFVLIFVSMLDVAICIITVIINVRAQQLFTMFDWRISALVHRGRQRISNRWHHKVSNTFSFDNAALCNVQPEIRRGCLYKVQLKVRLLLAQEVFVLRTEQTALAHYNWLELLFVRSCTDYAHLFIAVQDLSGTINKSNYILDLIVAWSCIL